MLNKKAIWQHDVSEVCNSSTYKVKLSAAQELLNMAVNDDNYRDMVSSDLLFCKVYNSHNMIFTPECS